MMHEPRRKPELLKAEQRPFAYVERSNPRTSSLELLTFGTYRIMPGISSSDLFHPREEALLFLISGTVAVEVEGVTFTLSHYDTLYIPLATPYVLENKSAEPGFLVLCRAPASNKHKPFYSSWEKFSKDEARIRHLAGKDVFLMFDVSESADKLLAGYTIFEPFARGWPPHCHSDQEEIYIFIKGHGAMEVYTEEETKTFVTSVAEMDAVTIPLLHYHPPFSQEEELHFIWCIAGERYWIGDKHKEFMKGTGESITT